jgi:chorismate lyase/3-hydroxybenzoate synthase
MQASPRTWERGDDLSLDTEPPVPAWVGDLVGAAAFNEGLGPHEAIRVGVAEGTRFRHVTAGFDGARAMDILTFQQRVVETYQAVFDRLQSPGASYPVRFWAFLPGIHDDMGAGLDRYMAFNAGRYGAYSARFGGPASFGRSVPTASAVGVRGDRLVLHCLTADEPGLPVENPRQIPAYCYSRRLGPMPPCFARGTLLKKNTHQPLLLVGGTASITGEDSRHVGQLEAQTLETFRNLANVVASATGQRLAAEVGAEGLKPFLAAFRELRTYYVRDADRDSIMGFVRASFPSLRRAEFLQASLCRAELLVEIEGLALPPHCPGD